MDIAKLKASIPEINYDLLRYRLSVAKTALTQIYKQIDIKWLAISVGGVSVVYALLFLYVYISGASYVLKLESKLASEIVAVEYIEQEIIIAKNVDNSTKDIVIEGLYEESKFGNLPIIGENDKLTSFRAYQTPFEFHNALKPIISFMITDYGLSKEQSKAALDLLPKEVSFMLSPYAALPDEWVRMAREKGHEVWMMLPIQNNKMADAGKNTIFHHASPNKKIETMKRSMARSSGYVGLASYIDEGINSAKPDYIRLADEIYDRGLGYFELNPNAPIVIKNRAFVKSAPYIKADLEIFKIKGADNSFEALELIANNKGNAVAVIPSYPNTIKNLAIWITKIAQSDYIIAPVSAVNDLQLSRAKNYDK